MNPLFLPNELESKLIQTIQKYCRNDFALIRMSPTMLKKSIIDASEDIRIVLRDKNIIDYTQIPQGVKYSNPSVVISSAGIIKGQTSLYRPMTKKGDPRFWVSKFKRVVSSEQLVYFTTDDESNIVAIILDDYPLFEEYVVAYFGTNEDEQQVIDDFIQRIREIKDKGWVLSVSPNKLNDKDIGETLERELGIEINNLKTPDFEGQIEVKGKKLRATTKDSLFNMVPSWDSSVLKSLNEIVITYGYPDKKYNGYNSLFVTVSSKPNKQGLYLEVDEVTEHIHQKCMIDGIISDVCSWRFDEIKERLYNKHPKTMWLVAEDKKINGQVHFKYVKAQFTQRPIFSQFISLVKQGLVTFDWRRRANLGTAEPLPSNKMDYGQGFRINPKNRHLLFGETTDIQF